MDQLNVEKCRDNENARAFCDEYLAGSRPRYVLGRNDYAKSIASALQLEGFIDDYAKESEFLGKPIVRIEEVPKDALVVSASVFRPLSAKKRLEDHSLKSLDYFSFRKYSGLQLLQVNFEDKFKKDFDLYRDEYERIFERLADVESKAIFSKIINFRLSQDLAYLGGFKDIADRQYFEEFLYLQPDGEVFVDVGSFDGYTSECFVKRCPGYEAVHIFEPEALNMTMVKEKLAAYPGIFYYPFGLSNCSQKLRFQPNGSASRIASDGDIEIQLVRLDDVLAERYTFLKMDIEGAERPAIEGAREGIIKNHPRLAISVYHRVDDLWRIPRQILSYRDDYEIFLRHYMEGVVETVMFFIPSNRS